MHNKSYTSSKQPDVVVIFEKEDEIKGVNEILVDQFDSFRAVALNKKTVNFIRQSKPVVLLFALCTVEKSIELYSALVEKNILNYPHHTVLLCSNKESAIAFRCCMKGFFDNYFVYQPLYERYRIVMIVHKELKNMLSRNELYQFNEGNFDKIDGDLAEVIDSGGMAKQALLSRLQESRVENEATPVLIQNLLSSLEGDIAESVDQIISTLKDKKQHYQEQAKKSKGLIHHQPAIKTKEEKLAALEARALEDTKYLSSVNSQESMEENNEQADDPAKILVVEDNAIYRNVLVNILSKANFKVEQAEDGVQALDKIRSGSFQLILMDLFMPKLDGLNATKKIKDISGGKEIPVIALTGNKSKENARKWIAQGIKGYIIKPSDKDEILAAVNKALN